MTQTTYPESTGFFRAASRRAHRILSLLLAATVIAVLISGVTETTTATPAAAATTGAGYSGITPYGGYLGNYIAPNGTRVYCMDSGREWPGAATDGGTLVSSLTTEWGAELSPQVLQKLNMALTNYGQTADPTQAAAVSAYIYAYTANYSRHAGQTHGVGAHYINGNATVLAAYNAIWADVEANYAGRSTGSATLTVTMANAYDGYVSVETEPTNATGTLTLAGAVDAVGGTSTVAVADGQVVPIRGVPDAGAGSYSVSAHASFVAPSGASPTVTVFSTGDQQRTLSGGTPAEMAFEASAQSAPIDLTFSPIVRTQVASTFVSEGDAFVDSVTASVAEGSAPWRVTDGVGVRVVAVGTLYGPLSDRPDVSVTPPADAPVVGSERLTLSGPGDYASAGTLRAPGAGFYTWVWKITEEGQPAATAEFLPDGYSFADQYGLVAETHVVPLTLAVASQASATEVGYGAEISDQLTVALAKGEWLSEGGVPIPAVFDGTAYFVPGGTAPAVSDVVPDNAVVLGTSSITANGPGIYQGSASVTAPLSEGFVTWVWSLSASSPTAAYFEPWTDQFGLPAETTRIAPPVVATQAIAASAIGDDVHDTALVGGVLPAQPSYLVFEAYYRESGADIVCDESTRVFDSSATPVPVTSVGNYDSPVTQFTKYGTYYWVETLYSHDHQLLHRGECGLPEETTVVAPGVVSTLAVPSVQFGEPAHDVATVEGLTPRGATLVFEAFVQTNPDGPVCTAETLQFASEPIAVTGAGTYTSPSTTFGQAGTYYWVETLRDRNGETLHRGVCGAPGETTTVEARALANTGAPSAQVLVVAVGLLGLGIVAVLGVVIRRRLRGRI